MTDDDVVKRTKARVNAVDVLEALGATFPWSANEGFWGDDEAPFFCPFCEDRDSRNPAGRVNEMTGLWFCFSCGNGGDIFTAVRKARGVGFDEALQWVLDKWPEEVTDFDPWADEETP